MLVRLRVLQGGQQPRVDLVTVGIDRRLGDRCGDHRVGAERQMRAVLFDRTQRLHEDAALGDAVGDLRSAEVDESADAARV
jgi:hypothetical protein